MRLITSTCVLSMVLFSSAAARGQEKAAREQSFKNLRAISKAFFAYTGGKDDGTIGRGPYPTHAIYSKDGKTPLLSWRVALLPYLGQEALFKEFKLDEPWDSQHNKKLIPKMPKVYDCSAAPEKVSKDGKTFYQVFTGAGTVFDGDKKITYFAISSGNGTSFTILAIEAKEPVIWTKPEDLTLPTDKNKMPAVGGLFKDGFHAIFCDTVVAFYPSNPPAAALRALVIPTTGAPAEAAMEKLRQKEK